MILALGGGRAKQNNGVSHFFAWGLDCEVSVTNLTIQTWKSEN